MPKKRTTPNRTWSKEQKLEIVREVTEGNKATSQVAKEYEISNGMLSNWIKKYINEGEDSLANKRKPGNPLSKYQARKELSNIEKLEYENMKLRIENERLKKGYLMKGDGTVVMFKK